MSIEFSVIDFSKPEKEKETERGGEREKIKDDMISSMLTLVRASPIISNKQVGYRNIVIVKWF